MKVFVNEKKSYQYEKILNKIVILCRKIKEPADAKRILL